MRPSKPSGWAFGREVELPPDYPVDAFVDVLEEALGGLKEGLVGYSSADAQTALVLTREAADSAFTRWDYMLKNIKIENEYGANLYATLCRERLLLTIELAARTIVMMDEALGKPGTEETEHDL